MFSGCLPEEYVLQDLHVLECIFKSNQHYCSWQPYYNDPENRNQSTL